jgi:1,4-dihydroxy-2-naphthoate octaprenyltransferase
LANKKRSTPSKAQSNRSQLKGLKLWIHGARLRTLPLAIAPILIGAGAAASAHRFNLALSALALFVALSLQIAVNFANDYSDGIRGTDATRVGPLRLTGSGSAKPEKVKYAAFLFFGLAGVAGLAIVLLTGFYWFIAVGVACILAAWFYTGGKNPYGYAGLGEIAVFIFFGLVATIGTAYIQIRTFEALSILGGVAAGLFAAAVLMVNNIRDLQFDQHVGKRTLAVKLGKRWANALYFVMIWLPFVIAVLFTLIYPAVLFAFAAIFFIAPATLIVASAKTPKELILALKLTSFGALAYAALFALGVILAV